MMYEMDMGYGKFDSDSDNDDYYDYDD
jgi:hypothetical protein